MNFTKSIPYLTAAFFAMGLGPSEALLDELKEQEEGKSPVTQSRQASSLNSKEQAVLEKVRECLALKPQDFFTGLHGSQIRRMKTLVRLLWLYDIYLHDKSGECQQEAAALLYVATGVSFKETLRIITHYNPKSRL